MKLLKTHRLLAMLCQVGSDVYPHSHHNANLKPCRGKVSYTCIEVNIRFH